MACWNVLGVLGRTVYDDKIAHWNVLGVQGRTVYYDKIACWNVLGFKVGLCMMIKSPT